jgi:cysteinyl-tRNA synthetase
MSTKYLGGPFDIHGGGIDNIFPHNECEIAQWEAASGQPFARYWMLTGTLSIDGVKMSKSLGNVLNIKDALKRYSPQASRFFILSSHYSNPIDFSDAALEAAAKGVERLLAPARLVRDRLRTAAESADAAEFVNALDEHRTAFVEAMDDNFNAPAALGVLSKLTTDVNTLLNSGSPIGRSTLEAIDKTYRDLGGSVLGVIPDAFKSDANLDVLDGLVRMLIDMRAEARASKDFARADAIRKQLAEVGVALEDGRDGTIWRLTK